MSGGLRHAAVVLSTLFLLAAVIRHLSIPGTADSSMSRVPRELSSAVGYEGAPEHAPTLSSPAREMSLALEDAIARMTSKLGRELEEELDGALASAPTGRSPRKDKTPAFSVHGKPGHHVECGDTVADGAISEGINGDLERAKRFHGEVGDVFTVKCPAHCGRYLSYSLVYGCGPYLDASAICMAAILDGKIGYEMGGYVAFQLVPPVPHYTSCYRIVKRYMNVSGATQLSSVRGHALSGPGPYKKLWSTFPFDFTEWSKAHGAARLTEGEYRGNKALTLYRTTCAYPDTTTDIGCAGRRAFEILNLRGDGKDFHVGFNPIISPAPGKYEGPLLVSIDAPRQRIFYTIDGSAPADDTNEMPSLAALRYGGPFYINKAGTVVIRAISFSSSFFPGISGEVLAEFDIEEPSGGFPEKLPDVFTQKSLQPRID